MEHRHRRVRSRWHAPGPAGSDRASGQTLGVLATPNADQGAQLHLMVARTMDGLRPEGASLAQFCVAAQVVTAASLGFRPAALDAVRHSQQAASEAAGQIAFEEAAGHLRRALAL